MKKEMEKEMIENEKIIQVPKQLNIDDYPMHKNEDIDKYNHHNNYTYKNIYYYICQFICFKN